MAFNDKAWHVGFKWTIGDPDNNTGAIALDEASDALHICDINDVTTNWNVSTKSHPTLYVHSATTPATDYISMYHDGDYAYLTVDGTTLLTMTTTSFAVAVDTTVAGDLDITAEDISVTAGKYIYLDGSTGNDFLRASTDNNVILNGQTTVALGIGGTAEVSLAANVFGPATTNGCALGSTSYYWLDLFLGTGAVINFNNDVTLTHASNLLTVAGGNLRMGTTDRIEFRDAEVHIYSRSDGRMTIGADTYLEVNAYTVVNNYLKLWNTDTDSSNLQGSMWMDTSDQTIKYRRWISGATFATRTLVNLEEAQTFTGVITVSSDNKLYFRDAAIYLWSGSDGNLNLVADTYVVIDAYTVVNNYLKLWNTDTDATSLQGSIWMDTSDQTIKYRRWISGTTFATRTIANLEEEQTFVEHLNMTGDKKLKFRDAGVFIHSNADGQLKLSADIGGATHNAITLAGNTRCTGYFCLHSTATAATDTAGQMWFDTDDQKIHFRDYTGERIVTSTAAV